MILIVKHKNTIFFKKLNFIKNIIVCFPADRIELQSLKFHLVKPSFWPVIGGFMGLSITMLLLFWFQYFVNYIILFLFLFEFILFLWLWWYDVIIESQEHTINVKNGLSIGMCLFIISEIMFFFAFFWSFFHSSLVPSIELGSIWPPVIIEEWVIKWSRVPLLNTILLLSSGVTITCVHNIILRVPSFELIINRFLFKIASKKKFYQYALIRFKEIKTSLNFFKNMCFFSVKTGLILKKVEDKSSLNNIIYFCNCLFYFVCKMLNLFIIEAFVIKKMYSKMLIGLFWFIITLLFAIAFTVLQIFEYFESIFNISDSIYGSVFFMMTGFHGIHVIIGTIFLLVCFFRIRKGMYHFQNSKGFEFAIWYWHFVDVVWLFLYFGVYIWGNKKYANFDTSLLYTEQSKYSSIKNYPIGNKINLLTSKCDVSWNWQCGFQDSATSTMEEIVELHHNIMFILIIILVVVIFLLLGSLLRKCDD